MKKTFPIVFLFLGLLLGGCAMTVPLDPSLLMLLMKNDGPPPKLDIVPKSDDSAPVKQIPPQEPGDVTVAG